MDSIIPVNLVFVWICVIMYWVNVLRASRNSRCFITEEIGGVHIATIMLYAAFLLTCVPRLYSYYYVTKEPYKLKEYQKVMQSWTFIGLVTFVLPPIFLIIIDAGNQFKCCEEIICPSMELITSYEGLSFHLSSLIVGIVASLIILMYSFDNVQEAVRLRYSDPTKEPTTKGKNITVINPVTIEVKPKKKTTKLPTAKIVRGKYKNLRY